ncbi:hypothetical protein LCGC14_2221770 [marine sediment metagenome]|mgnify:CR=1 FL=1|uniref:Core-binding (CB) domain-containing protein n=1 Tax=marine sediment metagenome TaxID=412755 RepID=A0A0F9DYD3_9ZZZZ
MPQLLTRRLVDDIVRSGRVTEVTDSRQPGLAVRSGPRKVQFVFVSSPGGRKTRLVLGLAGELQIDDARDLARKASDLVAQGLIPDLAWVRRERNPVAPEMVVRRKTWTFAEARGVYLAEVAVALKPATLDDYRKALNHSTLERFKNRPVCDITEEEMSEALAGYHRVQQGNGAAGLKRRLSAFWSFLQRADNRMNSGVRRRLQIDLPPTRYREDKPLRFPHPGEVAALYKRAKAGELGAASAAVMLLCLTVQRRETVVTARIEHVHDGIWHIPPVHRKTAQKRQDNRVHTLPWPEDHLNAAGDPWLFPATRPRRFGLPVGHMAGSTITHAFLGATVGFSPHDVRRSFQTTMSIHGFSEAAAALILDHNEGPATVAKRHYSIYRDLPEKRRMLAIWQALVLGGKKMSDKAWEKETGQKRLLAKDR